MKHLFAALSVLLLAGSAAHAGFDAPPPPPGFGGGNFGHGPGHGGFVPPPPPPPSFGNHDDERDRDWRHGPRWGEHDHDGWHHGGPGFPGHGFPPPPPPPPPMGITQFIECESHGYGTSYCAVPGFIVDARVTNQRSFAACELGQSYGFQGNQLWVSGGCRATFAVIIRR